MTKYSMTSLSRRKHQRWLNKFCRVANHDIAEDPLWLGRFVIEQKATKMEWFDDNSGGLMYCHLQLRDKKTGTVEDWYTDCLELPWHYFRKMNDFIIKKCQVWENERPYEERRDYRNVK